MRLPLRFSCSLVLLGCAGCGGIADGDDRANVDPARDRADTVPDKTPTGTGPRDRSGLAPIVGNSFDLTFSAATATLSGASSVSGGPPSLRTSVRLDIYENRAGALEAVFMARWGTPAMYSVVMSDAAVTLTGKGIIAEPSLSGTTDEWKTIVLARTKDGALDGTFTGDGEELVALGDVLGRGALTGSGTLVGDATAPEVRTRPTSFTGRDDALLPWDPITLEVAELVMAGEINRGWQVAVRAGVDELAVTLEDDSLRTPWLGMNELVGHVSDWDKATGKSVWELVAPEASYFDMLGRPLVGFSKELKFVSVGATRNSIQFDDDVVQGFLFGDHARLGGGIGGTADPRCESGGCLRIGPVTYDGCALTRAGFAAQLERPAAGRVELRYRVLARPKSTGGPSKPFLDGALLTMQTASRGGPTTTTPVTAGDALVELPTAIGEMTWGTAWTTLDVAAPAGSGSIGIAVASGGPTAARAGCGGPPLPPAEIEILVESVTAK